MKDEDFELSKSEVRGKRSNKGDTKKKFERHSFDDEAHVHNRKAAGKRKHSRFHEVEDFSEEELDEDGIWAMIDPRMIK